MGKRIPELAVPGKSQGSCVPVFDAAVQVDRRALEDSRVDTGEPVPGKMVQRVEG